jgi:hypothetical protein
MARFYENDRNTPPPRPPGPMPPGDVARRPAPMSPSRSNARMPAPMSPSRPSGRMSGELDALMSLLTTPSRVARGAIEGGARAVNPDFEMPDYSNAQIPGIDFIKDMMRGGGQNNEMPLPRSFDPGTDALLRAYMRQMQGGR